MFITRPVRIYPLVQKLRRRIDLNTHRNVYTISLQKIKLKTDSVFIKQIMNIFAFFLARVKLNYRPHKVVDLLSSP